MRIMQLKLEVRSLFPDVNDSCMQIVEESENMVKAAGYDYDNTKMPRSFSKSYINILEWPEHLWNTYCEERKWSLL